MAREQMGLLVDGVLVHSAQMTSISLDDDDNQAEGLRGVLNGAVDDARVYDRALSVPEIQAILEQR